MKNNIITQSILGNSKQFYYAVIGTHDTVADSDIFSRCV